jgi:predicted house-cleaning noncanonical NTP pyrophosphatase (MazG superfamily)
MVPKNKLARDKTIALFESQGRKHTSYVLNDADYARELRNKLKEETAEFLEDNNLEELADILEVLYALTKNIGHTKEELEKVRAEKAEKYGIWENKIYLVELEPKKN